VCVCVCVCVCMCVCVCVFVCVFCYPPLPPRPRRRGILRSMDACQISYIHLILHGSYVCACVCVCVCVFVYVCVCVFVFDILIIASHGACHIIKHTHTQTHTHTHTHSHTHRHRHTHICGESNMRTIILRVVVLVRGWASSASCSSEGSAKSMPVVFKESAAQRQTM
jgi:hypothetical protein